MQFKQQFQKFDEIDLNAADSKTLSFQIGSIV